MTPETLGGYGRGQIEVQKTNATLAKIDTSQNTVTNGLKYEDVGRTGYLAEGSLIDQFDLYWSHTGSANSMLGGKFQFWGSPRAGSGDGHKGALAVAFGGNDHQEDGGKTKYNLSGREISLLYGYRLASYAMPYTNLSFAKYDFEGKVYSTNSAINGKEPSYQSTVNSLNNGVEFAMGPMVSKLELTYQILSSNRTKERTRFIFGYTIGLTW